MNRVLKLYNQLAPLPLGKHLFSFVFWYMLTGYLNYVNKHDSMAAPYFRTILPVVQEMKPQFAQVRLKQRWGVQNHIKTVHAIAVCNLVEMTMGLVAEASIPSHLRWLPKGMDIKYTKKATGTLTATASIDPNFFNLSQYPGDVHVPVSVRNADGIEVTNATVNICYSFFLFRI